MFRIKFCDSFDSDKQSKRLLKVKYKRRPRRRRGGFVNSLFPTRQYRLFAFATPDGLTLV